MAGHMSAWRRVLHFWFRLDGNRGQQSGVGELDWSRAYTYKRNSLFSLILSLQFVVECLCFEQALILLIPTAKEYYTQPTPRPLVNFDLCSDEACQ
jgi:hypothetical protein